MLENAGERGYVIGYSTMCSFCGALERLKSDEENVYFFCSENRFCVFSQNPFASVFAWAEAPDVEDFRFGVEAKRLIKLFKRLHIESPVYFKPEKNALRMEQDNLSVKLPNARYEKAVTYPHFYSVDNQEIVGWFVRAMGGCVAVVPEMERMPGVLIDNTDAENTKILKFGNGVVRVGVSGKIPINEQRYVLPSNLAKTLAYFRHSTQTLLFSDHCIGATLSDGVSFYTPLLADSHPQEYEQMLQLGVQPSPDQRYVFSQSSLLVVLELISTMVEKDEASVQFDLVGESEEGKAVWQLSAKTFNGLEIVERVECIEGGAFQVPSFRLNKSAMLNIVRSCAEKVVLDDFGGNLISIKDKDFSNTTLVFKDFV